MSEPIQMRPIAHIRSAFPTKFGIPRQSGLARALTAQVVFEPPYREAAALRGLEELSHLLGPCPPVPPPPMPQRVLSPRQALFAPREEVPLEACEGRTAACQLAPYPPGVPVVAPGERITKKELSYFRKIGYNKQEVSVTAE